MDHNTAKFGHTQPRTANLTETERHGLLSSERRRTVLDVLEDQPTHVPLAELAPAVAKEEDGLSGEDSETVNRVKITLHHTHLPKMDDLGVLRYDPESNLISQ